jgi:hypothetical protein
VAAAGRRLEEDWERLVTLYTFPKDHWKHEGYVSKPQGGR